jgi:phosphatidate cytidylyltransferase
VLLGTWASDIFAYFGGRLLGRHRLAPAISPNKTVEGFVIGLAAGVFTTWVTLYREGFTNREALLVGAGVALAAPLGDLFESFLKRDLGVKHSGTLLAGHGGVLDRIDALLFAGPAALAIVALLGKA